MSLSYSNTSVIGGPLSQTVLKQLEARKNIVSKIGGRGDRDVLYLNSNTGWVRLTSSIDERDQTDQKASKYILTGGTAYSDGSQVLLKKGFIPESGDSSGYSLSDLTGFTPQPGIVGFHVKSKNTFGTLREASVEFLAYSVEDFNTLESLYLRPGYTVLLEWGHSLFLNNDGELNSTVKTFDTERFLTPMLFEDIDKEIVELKKKNSGNYDGIFGFIKNFSWSFNGYAYVCSVDIISKGELIESIALSIAPSYDTDKEDETKTKKQYTTDLHKFLNSIKNAGAVNYFDEQKIIATEGSINYLQTIGNFITNPFSPPIIALNQPEFELAQEKQDIEKEIADEELINYMKAYMPTLYDIVEQELADQGLTLSSQIIRFQLSDGSTNAEYQWSRHITLRVLLILLNNIFLLKSNKNYVFKFFTGSKEADERKIKNNFLTFESHIGLDPSICSLGKSIKPNTNIYYPISTQANFSDGEQKDILNIFVSTDYILEITDKLIRKESTSQGTILELVQQILTGVENNLGSINEFDLHQEEETNTYFVVDRKVVPSNNDFGNFLDSYIDVIGLKTEVESLEIKSAITANISSMIAIAAQDSALPGGSSDVLNMQKWNQGLVDRHLKLKDIGTKLISTEKDTPTDTKLTRGDIDKFERFVRKLDNYNPFYLRYNTEELYGFKPIHEQIMREYSFYYSRREETNPHGLIPFELHLKLKGIGGLKIGQAFKIPDTFLPTKYKGNVAFIITGIEHTIANNRWTTNLKTQMILTSNYEKVDAEISDVIPLFEEEDLRNLTYYSPLSRALVTRKDSQGGGDYSASRGSRLHLAWDVKANPFESVKSPIRGKIYSIENWSKPSNSDTWLSGVRIKGIGEYEGQIWRLGYVAIDPTLTKGKVVNGGQHIGTVQEMAKEYGEGMDNHLHIDVKTSINRVFAGIDPKTLIYS